VVELPPLPEPARRLDDAIDEVLRPFVRVEPPLDPRNGLLLSGVWNVGE